MPDECRDPVTALPGQPSGDETIQRGQQLATAFALIFIRDMPRSLVQDHGVNSSHCGYCDRDGTFVAHGMTAKWLDVEDYNLLLDRSVWACV